MAKRVAVPDEETVEENGGIKAKKKRNCCCTCCLIVLIVVLVIFLAAFVAGWILGDKYTKKLFGLSMADTMGVVNDLYWTDDDDVVTRPFNQKDLNGFYSEIKRNILLKDEVEVDFDTALNAAIDKYLESGESVGDKTSAKALNVGDGDKKESDSDITDILVNMIADVLDRDNIDIERLNRYDANNPASDEYIFNLNDKQLAAFVNSVLKRALKNASKLDSVKEISDIVRLDTVVALKQIRFTARSAKNENGVDEVKASSAEITVWLGLQEAANQAIKKFMADLGQSWAGGIVGWLGNVILPENIYLTVSVPLIGDNKASLTINDMDAEERARANKLINGIIKLMTDDEDALTLDDVIDNFIKDIKPMLEQATDRMDFTNANGGTIKMDLLDSVAKLASEGMAEGTQLTKADFLYVLQALFSDRTEQLNKLRPFRYDNWYMVDGKIVYMPSGGKKEDKIDYEQEFIKEIGNKYAINFDDGTTLTNVLEMLGISLDGSNNSADSKDLLGRVDGDKFNALLDRNIGDIKLTVTDRMLGAALSKQMQKIVKGNADMDGLEMQLDALTFVKKAGDDSADHLYALLAVEAKIGGMLDSMGGDGDKLMTKLATGLMPESILLTMTVDITRDRSVTRDKAEFIINSCANTDRVLETLEKLVPDFKLTDISDKVSDTLNDMLDQMDGKVNIELVPHTFVYDEDKNGWLGNSGALVMPDIFTVVTDMVLVKDGKSVVTPEQLKNVIRDLNNPAEIEANNPDDGCEAFIEDVFDKYYLQEPADKITDFDGLTKYMNSEFKTDNLRVHGNDGLAHDARAMDDLRPVMSSDELFALLKNKIKDNGTTKSYSILNAEVGDNTLKIMVSVGLKDLLDGAGEVRSLIKADVLYTTATFHTSKADIITVGGKTGYAVDFDINIKKNDSSTEMDEDTLKAMLDIVRFFSPEFDIEKQLQEFGVILYEQMNKLNDSLGGSAERTLFTFTNEGLRLTDFYTFLALNMEPELLDDGYTNEDIRKTVQGLYEYDSSAPNDNNFKASEIMFNLPSDKGGRRWTQDEVKGNLLTGELGLYGNTHVDVDFNGFLKQGVETMASDGEVNVEQTMILAKGDNRANVQAVRDWLNSRLTLGEDEDVDTSFDYMAITFSMNMTNYVGDEKADGSNDAESLFPEKIYATVVYKYDADAAAGDRFTVVGGISDVAPVLVFNNMDGTQYEIMVRLMNANPGDVETGATDEGKVNMKSIAKRGADVLNGMSHYEYNGLTAETVISFSATVAGESGMGKIYISMPTINSQPSAGV
ncbi:MAG: hypothetical protein K2O04_03000 [Clostridiales bacterium]|nr:hypothetical protein [Clostridiales bacterium]